MMKAIQESAWTRSQSKQGSEWKVENGKWIMESGRRKTVLVD
jgi:hypothetical protein